MDIKQISIIGMLGTLALAVGCIDSTTTVTVKKDGSGSVVETVYISQSTLGMMGMMGMMSSVTNQEIGMVDQEKYKAQAHDMGEDIAFVSAKQVKKPDGTIGEQIIYSFKDVTKIQALGSSRDTRVNSSLKKPITFAFTKGPTCKLTINMNMPKLKLSKKLGTPIEQHEPAPEKLAMTKQMLDGFRLKMVVEVDGEIVMSNATYVQKPSADDKKQSVTLFDVDMGKALQDESVFKKLAAAMELNDINDIPGFQIETAEKVDIEFK